MHLVSNLIKKLFGTNADQTFTLLQSSGKILLVQVTGVLLLLLNNFLIIRYAGEQNYGTYVSIMIWINLFSVIAVLGMDDRFIALVPKYTNTPYEKNIFSILHWAFKTISLSTPIVCLLIVLLVKANILKGLGQHNNIVLCVLLLSTTVLNVLVQFLRSINRLFLSQVLDKVIRSILSISFVLFFIALTRSLSVHHLILTQVIAMSLCIGYCFYYLSRYKAKLAKSNMQSFNTNLGSNFYFLAISLLNLLAVRLDILFLSETALPQEVGYYNIAVRFADIIHYPVTVINLIVPMMISKAWHTSSSGAMHQTIRQAAVIGLAGTAGLLLFMAVFGPFVLSLFGKNFAGSYPIVLLLGASHLLTAFSGPLNTVFMVGGKEKISLYSLIAQVIATLTGCYFLIPRYHTYGAACAVIAGNGVYLMLITWFFYRSEKVLITPFRIFRVKDQR